MKNKDLKVFLESNGITVIDNVNIITVVVTYPNGGFCRRTVYEKSSDVVIRGVKRSYHNQYIKSDVTRELLDYLHEQGHTTVALPKNACSSINQIDSVTLKKKKIKRIRYTSW